MGPLLEITKSEIPEIDFQDKFLKPIWEKVLHNEDLTLSDGVKILETEDFASVGIMADSITKNITGDKVYFVLNRHINPTNICVKTNKANQNKTIPLPLYSILQSKIQRKC